MSEDHHVITSAGSSKFNSTYVGTCAGSLRVLIVGVGVAAIILASIGSPNDLSSFDGNGGDTNFYGYGLGYIIEPLNIIYILLIISAFIFSFIFIISASCVYSGRRAMKTNRILHFIFGLALMGALICGSIGSYYFWEGCCHVFPPAREEEYLRYHYEDRQGYRNWCRCSLVFNNGGGETKHKEVYEFREAYKSLEIISAWPHHMTAHILSLVFVAVDMVLYFVAACIA